MRRAGILAWLIGLFSTPVFAAPGDPPAYSDVFEKSFAPGFSVLSTIRLDDGTARTDTVAFRVIEIGKLIITSSRIAAADPFVGLSTVKPFVQAVPNGTFRVRLAVGDHPSGDVKDNRVSFARVDFTDRPVARWSMALIEGQVVATLKDGEIFGYPVDAGTGSFFDPAVQPAIDAMYAQKPDIYDNWQTEGEANGPKVVGPYSFVLMLPAGPANVAMFHSGWGDGFYTSWFGYDADGKVAALLTDFNTIDWNQSKW